LYRRDWFNLFGDVLSEGSMSLKGVSNLFETKESAVGDCPDFALGTTYIIARYVSVW